MTHTSNREEGRVRQKTGRLDESTAAAHRIGSRGEQTCRTDAWSERLPLYTGGNHYADCS